MIASGCGFGMVENKPERGLRAGWAWTGGAGRFAAQAYVLALTLAGCSETGSRSDVIADLGADADSLTEVSEVDASRPDASMGADGMLPDSVGPEIVAPTPAEPCDENTPCPALFVCKQAHAGEPGVCLPALCETDADCDLVLPTVARGCCARVTDGTGKWLAEGACGVSWAATCPANQTWSTLACGVDDPACDDDGFECLGLGLGSPTCHAVR